MPLSFEDLVAEQLTDLPLGALRTYERTGSTNIEASRWAAQDAPDLALVVADEQTAGKGRQNRRWFTPPGSALAFSLVLHQENRSTRLAISNRPNGDEIMRWTALGALAVCQALHMKYSLGAQIKWPNDVLIGRRKTAGILAEAHWQGDQLQAVILGIGINIAPDSVPADELVSFPATCIEAAVGQPVRRFEVLREVIQSLLVWRVMLYEPVFIQTWDNYLAFKGEWMNIKNSDPTNPTMLVGFIIGLDEQGRLRLRNPEGEEFRITTGELSMQPAGTPPAEDHSRSIIGG